MTDFIAIAETETDPGAPSRSSLWKRWAKNWIAGFEGAVGAPRLQFAALDPAFSTAGGVGSYVFAKGTADQVFGATVAGSTLQPTSAPYSVLPSSGTAAAFDLGSALTGTWRCMGRFDLAAGYGGGGTNPGATLWLRIL